MQRILKKLTLPFVLRCVRGQCMADCLIVFNARLDFDARSATDRQAAKCHMCLRNGVTATDHRSGRKCPFYDSHQQDHGAEEDVSNNDGALAETESSPRGGHVLHRQHDH
ncbi:hypothetical protein PBRA_007413 [Plasmodiophora brassicae]|uniref:Uncharacterized protein n=1 Tax=Plasmodiophora brassicae TaxID=37360 RepID=A0A0G4IXB5_PLABS|nr:hypothetical protein PBRA_007413 [Plasmodiophora brassicae]